MQGVKLRDGTYRTATMQYSIPRPEVLLDTEIWFLNKYKTVENLYSSGIERFPSLWSAL